MNINWNDASQEINTNGTIAQAIAAKATCTTCNDHLTVVGNFVPVLAVGRIAMSQKESGFLTSAIHNMLNLATNSIYISQQSMTHPKYGLVSTITSGIDYSVIDILAKKALAGVDVKIVLSQHQRSGGYNSSVSNTDLMKLIKDRSQYFSGYSKEKLCEKLQLMTLHNGTSPVNNHAKTILVDNRTYFIGSHNLYDQYPAVLSEFGYVISNQLKGINYYNSYWSLIFNDYSNKLTYNTCLEI